MKHVLITGGSDGLGKATARELAADGFTVTILGRDEAKTKAVAAEIGCCYVVADVADATAVERATAKAVQQNGEVDILINNAGIWIAGPIEDNQPRDIQRALDVNTLGTITCTQAVVPAMKERRSGRIINVVSQAGLYGKAERTVYNATKWAITGFTKSLQPELKPYHIAVSGFYPGGMQTAIFDKAGETKVRVGMLDPAIAADFIAYVCKLPDHVDVPEFGIQSLDY